MFIMFVLLQAATEHAAGSTTVDPSVHDEGFLVHMLPYIVLGASVIFVRLFRSDNSGTLPHHFLKGVIFWTKKDTDTTSSSSSSSTAAASAGAAAAAPAVPAAAGSKKKVRKVQQQQQLNAVQHRTSLLQPGYLYPKLLLHLEFTEDLDTMLRFLMLLLLTFSGAMLTRIFVTPRLPTHTLTLLTSGWGYLVWTLIKVEWSHLVIRREEKLYMSVAGVLGALAAYALLVMVPPQHLAFNAGAAVEEATHRMAAAVRSRFKALPPDALVPFDNPEPLGVVLALLAGLLAGLLMAPGIRYGRLLQGLMEPPLWATAFRTSGPIKLLAGAGFALQLLLTPLWVDATSAVLRLPPQALLYLRGLALLAAALLQTLSAPYLLQAFLYATPFHEHVVSHNPAASDDLKAKTVKKSTQVTLSQASKVTLQLLVVPALMGSSALAYLLCAAPSPLARVSPAVSQWDMRGSALVTCGAGFVGWWSSTVFMMWASVGVVLARLHSRAMS